MSTFKMNLKSKLFLLFLNLKRTILDFSCTFLTTNHKVTNIFFTISFYFSWSNPCKKFSLSLKPHGQSSHQLKHPHLCHLSQPFTTTIHPTKPHHNIHSFTFHLAVFLSSKFASVTWVAMEVTGCCPWINMGIAIYNLSFMVEVLIVEKLISSLFRGCTKHI